MDAPWKSVMEGVGVLALAGVGAGLGWWNSRWPGRGWMLGYFLPLGLLVLIGLLRWLPPLTFGPPLSWLTAGRTGYALAGFITTWLLTTPLSRLPRRETRRLIVVLMVLVVGTSSVVFFVSPALNYHQLKALHTKMDLDGVCRQGTDYTCGPAAAVTILRRLGWNAEEGELAILAYTIPFAGTQPDLLARALTKRYGPEGLIAEYRHLRTVGELPSEGNAIAVVKYSFLVDHYVAVLATNEREVVVGDPLQGRASLTHSEFESRWRHTALVLRRAPPNSAGRSGN